MVAGGCRKPYQLPIQCDPKKQGEHFRTPRGACRQWPAGHQAHLAWCVDERTFQQVTKIEHGLYCLGSGSAGIDFDLLVVFTRFHVYMLLAGCPGCLAYSTTQVRVDTGVPSRVVALKPKFWLTCRLVLAQQKAVRIAVSWADWLELFKVLVSTAPWGLLW